MMNMRPREEQCKFFAQGNCTYGNACKFPHCTFVRFYHTISQFPVDPEGNESRGADFGPPAFHNQHHNQHHNPSANNNAMRNNNSGGHHVLSLFVEQIPPGTKEADLIFLFSQYGPVQGVSLSYR
jgi:hypothetical protein